MTFFQQCVQVQYSYEPQCTTVYEQACTQVPVQVPRTISVPRYAIRFLTIILIMESILMNQNSKLFGYQFITFKSI
jgi:hypothetical protein